MTTRGVAVVIVRDERFLVIRRSAHVRAPLTYCFPGGSIEPGESEEQAVARELLEELGVSVTPQRRLWQIVTPWGVELSWWPAELESEALLIANPLEVESWHWHTAEEMLDLAELLASNREFLAALKLGSLSLE